MNSISKHLVVLSILVLSLQVSAQMPDTNLYIQKQKVLDYHLKNVARIYQTNIGGYTTRIKSDIYKADVKENIIKLYDKKKQSLTKKAASETDQTKKNDMLIEIKGLTDSISSELTQVKKLREGITGFVKECKIVEQEYMEIRFLLYQYQNNEIPAKRIDDFNKKFDAKYNKH